MHGTNPVTKPFRRASGDLKVNSIFPTLQGEGPSSGTPAVFVRLTHCNLRCYFCDTEFEYGKWFTHLELTKRVLKLRSSDYVRLVVITGGEPLLQNLKPFVQGLERHDCRVEVETAGTTWADNIADIFYEGSPHRLICSPKTPTIHPRIIPLVRAWKYIVREGLIDPNDGLPLGSTQNEKQRENTEHRLFRPPSEHPAPIFIQPMDEGFALGTSRNVNAAVQSCYIHGHRLSLQTHKIVGVP